MKKLILNVYCSIILLVAAASAPAATLYVWTNCPTPGAPYNAWTNAALTIQTAVDAAGPDDTVLVTNGVYDTGLTKTPGYALSNRVCIAKAITVRSFNNDPANTIIKGAAATSGTNGCGDDAVRCVFLTNGASLVGFTLTNGCTMTNGNNTYDKGGGGILLFASSLVSNCVISGNKGLYYDGGDSGVYAGGALLYDGGTMNNCTIAGNRGNYGGGVYLRRGTMNNCVISGNTGNYGGGYYGGQGTMNSCVISGNTAVTMGGGGRMGGTLNNCIISGNTAGSQGGGLQLYASSTVLKNCTISGNRATTDTGGGLWIYQVSTLSNCTISGNTAGAGGGGVYLQTSSTPGDYFNYGTLYNCVISGNTGTIGGGVYFWSGGALNNCTVSSNTATSYAGGLYFTSGTYGTGVVNNCIIWGNNGTFSNVIGSGTAIVSYTCSGPIQLGAGNIGLDPRFAAMNSENYRLTDRSPCINTGTNLNWMVNYYDLDGHSRIDRFSGIVDMGAYEFINSGTIYGFY